MQYWGEYFLTRALVSLFEGKDYPFFIILTWSWSCWWASNDLRVNLWSNLKMVEELSISFVWLWSISSSFFLCRSIFLPFFGAFLLSPLSESLILIDPLFPFFSSPLSKVCKGGNSSITSPYIASIAFLRGCRCIAYAFGRSTLLSDGMIPWSALTRLSLFNFFKHNSMPLLLKTVDLLIVCSFGPTNYIIMIWLTSLYLISNLIHLSIGVIPW